MKDKLLKFWKDPVGSKLIANLIWAVLLAMSALAYIIYQKISLSISFGDAWTNLMTFLDRKRTITNWVVFYSILTAILLLINRQIILKILTFILKAAFNIRSYDFNYNYNFTNQGKRTTGVISTEKSGNIFKIKPIGNTKEWGLSILFSHNYNILDTQESATEIVKLSKKYSENQLKIASFNKGGHNIPEESKIILENYEDQEFELKFDFAHDQGGILVTIKRYEKELFKSTVKYGCSYFKIIAEDCEYDFDLGVNYNRYE
jgi:hypothetical protein